MMDINILSARGMVFAWYKDLWRDGRCRAGKSWTREIIKSTMDGRTEDRSPKIQILPDEEEFHEEEMNMVYKGIYVRHKLLFDLARSWNTRSGRIGGTMVEKRAERQK